LDLDSASRQQQAVRKRKFKPELECKALPTLPQLASSAPRGHATPENAVFPIDSATVLLPSILRVTEIRSALRVAYPAGDGSAAILRSMLPKSRRVGVFVGSDLYRSDQFGIDQRGRRGFANAADDCIFAQVQSGVRYRPDLTSEEAGFLRNGGS
jgi:hypothetical protein